LPIYEIYNSRDSFTPKMRRKKRRNQKCASCLYNMAMFAFSNTILSMNARTRELSKSTLRGQKLAKNIRQILTTRVGTKNSNRSRKLCVNHAHKRLVNGTQLRIIFHKINPNITGMIINKNDIIFVTTLCSKGCRAPYI